MPLTLSHNRWALAGLAGALVFLAFEKFCIVPTIFFFAIFLNTLTFRCQTFWSGFRWGFLVSFIVMLGGFYWVIYVIHEFGFLPYWVASLLFLGFCGFGALNFPLYVGICSVLHRRIRWNQVSRRWLVLWFSIALPALFTMIEFIVPKLFPWFVGHSLYRAAIMTQISEFTGSSYLTFLIFSFGSTLSLFTWENENRRSLTLPAFAVPVVITLIALGVGVARLDKLEPAEKKLRVGLIQPNIGSLIKFQSRQGGAVSRVRLVVDTYKGLTEKALANDPKPDLILWPETAMPFHVTALGSFPQEIRDSVIRWNTPLITGGYAPGPENSMSDYNAAFLLEPQADKTLRVDLYRKNILLAFGEYMPMGEAFPKLYQMFPAVSRFARGREQQPLLLKDGTRLGVTICYEAIVPSFFRKVTSNGVNAVINLTNDSWFGPTSEPLLHASLTVFRAIESRVPMARVTNTGISFFVDRYGRMSETTGIYEEGVLVKEMEMPGTPPVTLYQRYGDWFIVALGALLIACVLPLILNKEKNDAPVPV